MASLRFGTSSALFAALTWPRSKSLLFLTALMGGCFHVDAAFRCDDDAQCRLGGAQGRCEPSGFCSFPDAACPSLRSYRGDAPAPYTDRCVSDDASVPEDLAVADLAASYLAATDAAPGDLGRAPCGYPQLLATVEDHENLPVGRVLRFQLASGGALPSQCAWLDGRGQLAPLPFAAAKIGNTTGGNVRIAVAGRHTMTLLDPETDAIVQEWVVDQFSLPIDVAPVWQADQAYAAVAYSVAGAGFYLNWLGLYKEGMPTPIERMPGQLGIENGYGMTTDPWNTGALVMLDLRTMDPQALESVNPFSTGVVPYFDDPGNLFGLAGFRVGAGARFAWPSGTQRVTVGESAWSPIFDGGAPSLEQLDCAECSELFHAVPDPGSPNAAFLLCAGTTEYDRKIFRAASDPAPSCVQVFDAGTFGFRFRLSHLGIAMP